MMTTLLLTVYLAGAEPSTGYPAPNLLVEVADPKLEGYRLLDVRPKAKYDAGHAPGAVHVNLEPWSKAILAGKADGSFWKAELAKVGVSPKVPVVVYGDDARDTARVWWMLKFAGVPDARILNGGWKAYTAAELPVQKEAATATAAPHDWKPETGRLADKGHVLRVLKGGAAAGFPEHCTWSGWSCSTRRPGSSSRRRNCSSS